MYIFAALLAFLAMSGVVSAGDTAAISAQAAQAMEVYLADDVTITAAAPGVATTGTGNVGVNSNVNWDLFVQGSDGGKMRYTPEPVDGEEIATNALKVSIGATVDQSLTGAASEILSNQAYGGAIVNVATYKQTFTYSDLAGAYGITVTWTIQPAA